MQIAVEIPDGLAAQFQARGLTPESYVRSLIESGVRTGPTAAIRPRPKMDMAAFITAMAAHSDKTPQLPDEAFTRESFYRDHD
jgi:hypothetical protein